MATVASSADQVVDLLQQLAIGSDGRIPEVPKPEVEAVAASNVANVGAKPYEKSKASLSVDPDIGNFSNGYPSPTYYYGGYGQNNEWINYSRYEAADPNSLSPMSSQLWGYVPYGTYPPQASPVPAVGNEVHHYLYPAHYYQHHHMYEGNKVNLSSYGHGGTGKGNSGSMKSNSRYSMLNNEHYGGEQFPSGIPSPTYLDPLYGYGGLPSPLSGFDSSAFSDGVFNHGMSLGLSSPISQTNNPRPLSNAMQNKSSSGYGKISGLANQFYPSNTMYGLYGNAPSTGLESFGYDPQSVRLNWSDHGNKYRQRGHGNGAFGYNNENVDGLNELNRGPRGKVQKIHFSGNGKDEVVTIVPDNEDYNSASFPVDYSDAKFFVIKSYSEDDVHKSIKYGVWASTPNGNKKLDEAYRTAKERPGSCPVFLFFSVNTSGQFVGVAEMVGSVDFDRTVEYWQQAKWQGCFPVKWHVIKDVQNTSLKHIKLENNDYKPVTNSRDTQEVELEQGIQILKIFKDDQGKSSILDDFEFYEDRERKMQEKKAKQHKNQKQILDVEFTGSAIERDRMAKLTMS